ncbi:MAG: methyltransferase domain-containing protein [Thermodesulfobacteriota bacterium]|nr:methyltransferase domain-containing protein [Thermodesulfobacteriota bacterium]
MAHEFDGKKYEKASDHQKEWGAKLISELALKGNERVLDLGCGDGVNTALIAKALPNGEVMGIDASKGMIDTAKPKEKTNLRFILMDIDEIAFEDEFDVIYSNATLHWVKDHYRLLRNVLKALRDGGLLRFNFAADGNCSHFFKVIRKTMEKEEFNRFFSDFLWPWYMPTITEYIQLVSQSELKAAKVWGEDADRYFPDTETMIGWVDQPSLVPFLACIPESHKANFREYVVGEMIRETKQADGKCFETFRRINLFAKK